MPNNESVGKKIVEALKKQAENMDLQEEQISSFNSAPVSNPINDDIFLHHQMIFLQNQLNLRKTPTSLMI